MLGALAVLTLVIVASALHRMTVYTDMYGLTRLRLLVAACEVWFGLVLAKLTDSDRRNCLLATIGASMPADDWRGVNLARITARDLIGARPVDCRG
ncbi:DUF4153 domain-containing protein [Actinoplanes couchii]|uniref:DUF4153 domain-containing protein n=1 Tax=Actinoplanes couchii TaxID=403638 RepID=UPI0035A2224B